MSIGPCGDGDGGGRGWINDIWYRIIDYAHLDIHELHSFQLVCKEADRLVREKPSLFWYKHPLKFTMKAFVDAGSQNIDNFRASSETNWRALVTQSDTYRWLKYHDTMPRISILLADDMYIDFARRIMYNRQPLKALEESLALENL